MPTWTEHQRGDLNALAPSGISDEKMISTFAPRCSSVRVDLIPEDRSDQRARRRPSSGAAVPRGRVPRRSGSRPLGDRAGPPAAANFEGLLLIFEGELLR
jgi:hypothetical protein